MLPTVQRHPSSYRDPSGFVFYYNDHLYRQVNLCYKEDYDLLLNSGLYDELIKDELLIQNQSINENFTGSEDWHITLQPQILPFISYAYEWSFDMLKDAALLTLNIIGKALKHGMILKDATPFNIQFLNGKPVFIDTLSFEKYDATKPWIAYRQFCENFLAPLALMHYLKMPLNHLSLAYPEGIPLLLASKMLPKRSRFNLGIYLHIHLHSKYSSEKKGSGKEVHFSEQKLKNIIRSLHDLITSFSLTNKEGVWSEYYEEAEQRDGYLEAKKNLIINWLKEIVIKSAVDVGANNGEFSKLLAQKTELTIALDFDHFSINSLYKNLQNNSLKNIQPLVGDLANLSPAIGVNNIERASLLQRINTDLVLALAVIHHLAIGKNIPFEDIAQLFSSMGKKLLIEFVPKDDEKIRLMLEQKKDIYQWYTQVNFEEVFLKHYRIIRKENIASSNRTLYLMESL